MSMETERNSGKQNHLRSTFLVFSLILLMGFALGFSVSKIMEPPMKTKTITLTTTEEVHYNTTITKWHRSIGTGNTTLTIEQKDMDFIHEFYNNETLEKGLCFDIIENKLIGLTVPDMVLSEKSTSKFSCGAYKIHNHPSDSPIFSGTDIFNMAKTGRYAQGLYTGGEFKVAGYDGQRLKWLNVTVE